MPADGADRASADALPPEFGFDAGERWLERLRDAVAPLPQRWVGPYQLSAEVSRGGQGVVYRARARGADRGVALKRMIGGALATPAAQARFEREVQLAAAIRHPGIVRVFGVEIVDRQPYLVMDWVDGEAITAWARPGGVRRPLRELVAALERTCDAVHHAHQHGVLHRDLKPTNVLVDAEGRPVVVDFGVAKAIGGDGGLTASDEFVGTLRYAAPEQLRSGAQRVDVRADVYALGAIAYELLTGRPIRPAADDLVEAVRALAAEPVERPSRLATDVDAELETVVLKAVADDPDVRYQSVDALREDLRRWLAGEPVLAHPPSSWYHVRQLIARNRLAVALGSLAVAALAALAVVSTVQSAGVARALARERRARAAAADVTAFIDALFRDLSPWSGAAGTVLGQVERATARIDAFLAPDAVERAALRETLAGVLEDLGQLEPAIGVWRDALAIRRRLAGDGSPGEIAAAARLGSALLRCWRLDEADRLLGPLESAADTPAVDPATRAAALRAVAALRLEQGRHAEARTLVDRAMALHGERDAGYAETLALGAEIVASAGRIEPCAAALEQALAVFRSVYGEEHPTAVRTAVLLARAAGHCSHLDRADQLLGRAQEVAARVLPADHPLLGQIALRVGELRLTQGRWDEAATSLAFARELLERYRGSDPEAFADVLGQLGRLATCVGRLDDAERHYRQRLDLWQGRPGARLRRSRAMSDLALMLTRRAIVAGGDTDDGRRDYAEAARLCEAAMAIEREAFGELRTAEPAWVLGLVDMQCGRHAAAEEHLCAAAATAGRVYPDGHPIELRVAVQLTNNALDRAVAESGGGPPDLEEVSARLVAAQALAGRLQLPDDHLEVMALGLLRMHVAATTGDGAGAAAAAEALLAVDAGGRVDARRMQHVVRLEVGDQRAARGDLDGAYAAYCAVQEQPDWPAATTPRQVAYVLERLVDLSRRRGNADDLAHWQDELRRLRRVRRAPGPTVDAAASGR